jgi:hypothetical protein
VECAWNRAKNNSHLAAVLLLAFLVSGIYLWNGYMSPTNSNKDEDYGHGGFVSSLGGSYFALLGGSGVAGSEMRASMRR